ncbi:diol dehydratase small subunit [Pseudoramibacter sp.]|jgi:propanediol dehydratase small subunit|uniref:diol dehydratase small subunit n=1 Tax=Pseudoramibacter sp. TaxID=2034862 RepID=UPI0025E115AE|nr:diol dehydratase small subunit [Pseudoramibacter sp.]MCH4072000.1 diol dehydratase small subunit [Pseudoramibacter sp.]MCH4105769.1 diol dehydratase small subunit [Pseudoramibacter sp.]
MTQEQMLEQIVKQVMASMSSGSAASAPSDDVKVTDADYPLGEKRPELITSATGIPLKELTLDKVLDGTLKAEDLRINPKTLELQAQVADSVGRDAFGINLRRAAELIAVPDARVLEIYNALRPYRSTKEELEAIADELENKYSAKVCAQLVREAAYIGYKRKRTKEFK